MQNTKNGKPHPDGCHRGYLSRSLTHWGRVTHICVGKLTIIGSDNGLSPSHYLNQRWNIVNWTLRNKLQLNFDRNSNIFIEENTFENVVWELLFISSRPQCVKASHCYSAGEEVTVEFHLRVPDLQLSCRHFTWKGWQGVWVLIPCSDDRRAICPVMHVVQDLL